MKNILILVKKELKRFFTDRRMVMSLLLPGILIFLLYSLMGDMMSGIGKEKEAYTYQIVVVNESSQISDKIKELKIPFDYVEHTGSMDEVKQKIADKEIDLYIQYSDDFYEDVTQGIGGKLTYYFNSSKPESGTIAEIYLSTIQSTFLKYTTNEIEENNLPNLASKEDSSTQFIVMLVPMLLMTFLFTGAMQISTESIAGEKERGTMTTLLATPVKRSHIALGKVIALSITALVSAASSFLGLMLSLPKLAGGNITLSMYTPMTFVLLFIVLITTVLIFVVLVSIISAYAKSVKEASALSTPLMIVSMLVGLSSMTGVTQTNTALYFIPIYNSVQSITAILSAGVAPINYLHLIITVGINLGVVGLGIYLMTWMFNSEKVMFNK